MRVHARPRVERRQKLARRELAQSQGFGDALVTYEQEPLWDRSRDKFHGEIIYPKSTILSEHTLVVIDKHIRPSERAAVSRFTEFLWTEQAQKIFVAYGFRSVREELNADAHGEVDEPSWRLKQTLRRVQVSRGGAVKNSKTFREYARQSFIDTMTLYLHGICCDIDVDTGPRQLPSRYLRKRLLALEEMFPPPAGYALFPEQLEP